VIAHHGASPDARAAGGPKIEPNAKAAAIIVSLMTVFIAMRTPRICRFDLCRRGGEGEVTKPGSFATADYSLKKSDPRRYQARRSCGQRWARTAFRQDSVVLRAAAWRVSAINTN
jgi:hypothetical protein